MVGWVRKEITSQTRIKIIDVNTNTTIFSSAASPRPILMFKNEGGQSFLFLFFYVNGPELSSWKDIKVIFSIFSNKRFLISQDARSVNRNDETAVLSRVNFILSSPHHVDHDQRANAYRYQLVANPLHNMTRNICHVTTTGLDNNTVLYQIMPRHTITNMFDMDMVRQPRCIAEHSSYGNENDFNEDANQEHVEDQTIEIHVRQVPYYDKMQNVAIQQETLLFDDLVVLGCMRILLGIVTDVELTCHPFIMLSKRFHERSRETGTLEAIYQRLQHIKDEGKFYVSEKYALIAYDLMLRHCLIMELRQQKTVGKFWSDGWRRWMLAIFLNKQYRYFWAPCQCSDSRSSSDNHRTKYAIDHCNESSKDNENKAGGQNTLNVSSDIVDSKKNGLHSQHDRSAHHKYNSFPGDQVPVPVWCAVRVKEGERELQVVEGSCKGVVNQGDVIRIGHPFLSRRYHVVGVSCLSNDVAGKSCIYIEETFDYSSVLYEEIMKENQKSSLLHNPTLRLKSRGHCQRLNDSMDLEEDSKDAYYNIDSEKFSARSKLAFTRIRIWKLVPADSDDRLQWRKEYDNGSVPWFDFSCLPAECHIPRNFLRVNVNLAQIDKNCRDCLSGPDRSIHQQRLFYFEKVPLNDIIIKTFQTMCNWHPVSSSIDMFKWARLARKMKFLTSVKKSNHRLDMIFMKHSLNRKLNFAQFRSVLKDIAAIRFPPSRYDAHESMENLLWSTVAMIPTVNEMIWTRAQAMAMIDEVRRVCAQTRIGAYFRMLQCKKNYLKIRVSAVLIQKYVRYDLMRRRTSRKLLLLRFDRIFRIRHLNAIVCQKHWRGYKRRYQFQIYKEQRQRMLQEARAQRRKKLQDKFRRCMQNVIYRKVQRIQSIVAIVWILLRDRRSFSQDVELEIQVFVPTPRLSKYFKLSENEIAKCLDNFILERGPMSLEEMLNPFFISHLTSRLWLQVVDDQLLTVNFNTTGVIEKGDLVHSSIVEFHNVKYVLSVYRSSSSIVIRLYSSKEAKNFRVKIAPNILASWLSIYNQQSTRGQLEALKVWELHRMFKKYDAGENVTEDMDKFGILKELLPGDSIPLDLSQESGLIPWIMNRINIYHDPISKNDSIVLQFETDAKRLEQMAIVLQRVWRGKRARMMAKEEVFRQYEKCFDMTLRAFFYVHTQTSQKQWSKPRLLSDNEDIADPPDEWRAAVYLDPVTNTSKKYYFNPLTGQSSWITEEVAARILQRKFRTRATQDLITSNLNFSQIVQAVKYTDDIERKYKQNPSKLSSRVNLALLHHCLKFDLDRAKTLYEDAISHSACHPVISRAYGIFILATSCDTDMLMNFKRACNFFNDAKVVDPGAVKFRSAIENFFYWSVLMNPDNPIALLNYALLHQCILGEYYRAEKIYRRALSFDSKHRFVTNNYNFFIDQLYPGGFYAGNGVPNVVIRRSQIKKTSPDWGEWRVMFDPLCTNSYDSFWYNSIDFSSSFEEPNWKDVWATRVRRSSRVTTDTESLWVEYFDPKLNASFLYNRTTEDYAWKRNTS